MFILDSHLCTPAKVVRFGRDLSRRGPFFQQVSFPKLLEGGVGAAFFTIPIPYDMVGHEATLCAKRMLEESSAQVKGAASMFATAKSAAQVRENYSRGLTSVLFGMDNSNPLDCSLLKLGEFRDLGVRCMALTGSGSNPVADSAVGLRIWGGLSPFGRDLVREMNRLGVIVDTANCSDESFYQCLELSETPMVSTRSCCRALCPRPGNMSDEMIRALADSGGVIQIGFDPLLLSASFSDTPSLGRVIRETQEAEKEAARDHDESTDLFYGGYVEKLLDFHRPGVEEIVDHIEHAVDVGGIGHVGIGSGFDGMWVPPEGLEDISMMWKVFDEMRFRGFTRGEIEMVAGGNFLRVMGEVEKAAVGAR